MANGTIEVTRFKDGSGYGIRCIYGNFADAIQGRCGSGFRDYSVTVGEEVEEHFPIFYRDVDSLTDSFRILVSVKHSIKEAMERARVLAQGYANEFADEGDLRFINSRAGESSLEKVV